VNAGSNFVEVGGTSCLQKLQHYVSQLQFNGKYAPLNTILLPSRKLKSWLLTLFVKSLENTTKTKEDIDNILTNVPLNLQDLGTHYHLIYPFEANGLRSAMDNKPIYGITAKERRLLDKIPLKYEIVPFEIFELEAPSD